MMIDYTSITKIIQSKQYVDITQHFARFWDFQHETLVSCHPLLFGDRHFWHAIADCHHWADVNEKLKR